MMILKSCKPLLLLLLQLFALKTASGDITTPNNIDNDAQAVVAEDERILQGRNDLIPLIPFDVQIALDLSGRSSRSFDHLNLVYLTDVVTLWMDDSFELKAASDGLLPNSTTYTSVGLVLENPSQRRSLRGPITRSLQADQDTVVFTASFSGVSLWERQGVVPMDGKLVELIQRATFLEGGKLLTSLQQLDAATGFGTSVLNVRAFITPVPTTTDTTGDDSDDSGTGSLEIIIIIAIVVACSAFGLLLFAVIWAWKTDQSKQQNFKNNNNDLRAGGTGSESAYSPKSGARSPALSPPVNKSRGGATAHNKEEDESRPPTEIEPGNYPESVISEDISTALTAYYKGMAGYGGGSGSLTGSGGSGGIHRQSRELNDAASMSSMDSYGYSLDGYAPSLSGGPTQMGYPVGPLGPVNGQIKDPNATDDEEEADLGVPLPGAEREQ
mmetsp:Transcript_103812/g.155436  ORF Transcript_103812/g.155436 Transcript_103812/m.155436 type:complete len:441 (+) Transcript_103812:230-1552(+)